MTSFSSDEESPNHISSIHPSHSTNNNNNNNQFRKQKYDNTTFNIQKNNPIIQVDEEFEFETTELEFSPEPAVESLKQQAAESDKSGKLTRLMAWISLLVAVFSLAAVGPTFLYLSRLGIAPIRAAAWRNQAVCLFIVIPAMIEWFFYTPKEERKWNFFRCSLDEEKPNSNTSSQPANSPTPESQPVEVARRFHVSWFILAINFCWGGSLALWVVAIPLTSTARASLFCSLYPLLLVGYMKWRGHNISRGEVFGVLISIVGIVVSEITSLLAPADPTQDQHLKLVGDILCILASILIAMNIVAGGRARTVMRLMTYTFICSVFVTFFLFILTMTFEDSTFDTDPQTGVFGWVHGQWLYLILVFGFTVGFLGLVGFNFAVKHVSPVIFSTVQLLDPGVTAVMSYGAGLESLPDISTFLGVGIVSIGIGFVVYYESKRKTQEDEQVKYAKVEGDIEMTELISP